MKIGIAGPISIAPFRSQLELGGLEKCPDGLGGTPVVALTTELLKRGHEVVVYTLDPEVTSEVILSGPQLKIYVGPYRRAHRARDMFRAEREYLASAIRREPCQVVHAHWTYEFALAALDSGNPTVVTAHDAPFIILRLYKDMYRAVRTIMAWQVARKSSLMTTVSPYVGDHFRKYLNFQGDLTIIPNGLPSENFARVESAALAPKTGTVTFASILTGGSRLKNGTAALLAFEQIRKKLPQSRLLLIGPDFGFGGLAHRWALQNHCGNQVEFIGSLSYERLMELLESSVDVLVHPSLEESFGMVLAEAMALHIPVIAGKYSGGVSYVLEGGKAGYLVDVRNPEKIAAAMLHLATDDHFRMQLANAGFETAKRRFDIAGVVDQYELLYRSAALAPDSASKAMSSVG